MKISAYAKINLGLRIFNKREDGYHNIETVLHRINLYDDISLELSSSITLTCNDPNIPSGDNNLCIRAAKLLQEYSGVRKGADIDLKKNIPVGAGLGGGSSDAAATLLGLIKLWNVNISRDELHQLALKLGSDVPYFLEMGTASATGRGEFLEYFDLKVPYWIVLAYPNIPISTAWAYQAVSKANHSRILNSSSVIPLKQILNQKMSNPGELTLLLKNDFEPVVLHTYEKVASVKIIMYASGAKFAQMSGSGSAVFGFFDSRQTADHALLKLGKYYTVFVTSPDFKP